MNEEDGIIGMLSPDTLAMVIADLRGNDVDEDSTSFGKKCLDALRAIVGANNADQMVINYQN